MGRRDYEMEDATKAVERAGLGANRACDAGRFGRQQRRNARRRVKSLFGRSRRKAGLHSRNALVLTTTSIRVFACDAHVSAEAAEKWSAFNASHSGSQTNRFYNITLTPTVADEPIVLQCPRTDSARTTIQALEDATGSKPSRITARRRKKQQREREAAAPAGNPESAEAPD